MRKDYELAKKRGDKAIKASLKNSTSPYLPVLDLSGSILREMHIGLLELPVSRIKGTKEVSRNNAFASNFMPIHPVGTEFACKWSDLYDAVNSCGVRDAIKVYEYMHEYYVQEGNKRVSVSKYKGIDFILADVIRIIPSRDDTEEVEAYYEYLDFYSVTRNYFVALNKPGDYNKLAGLLGEDLNHRWSEDLCHDLKAAYFIFNNNFKAVLKEENDYVIGNAFLTYISLFSLQNILNGTHRQIKNNIRLAQNELLCSGNVSDSVYFDSVPKIEKKRGIRSLFSGVKTYKPTAPLKVGFVYEKNDDTLTELHRSAQSLVEKSVGSNVVITSYYSEINEKAVMEALENTIKDNNKLVFTVSPDMTDFALKAAVDNPKVHFLNYSWDRMHAVVKCYYEKIYEAAFLMGIAAAHTMCMENNLGKSMRIGYIARSGGKISLLNVNAFSAGVSLIIPDCTVSLKNITEENRDNYCKEFEAEGVTIFADFEGVVSDKSGVYNDNGELIVQLVHCWEKFYLKVIQSFLDGNLNHNGNTSVNYWFGLSEGVIDVRACNLSAQTEELMLLLKNAVAKKIIDPLSENVKTQYDDFKKNNGIIRTENSVDCVTSNPLAAAAKELNENIDGTLEGIF